MLSSTLRSPGAIQINIEIMRIFIKLKRVINSSQTLENRLDALEEKYDDQFQVVFDAIREMVISPEKTKRPIGFERVCLGNEEA